MRSPNRWRTERLLIRRTVLEDSTELNRICASWKDKIYMEGDSFSENYIENCIMEGDLPPIENADAANFYMMTIQDANGRIIGFLINITAIRMRIQYGSVFFINYLNSVRINTACGYTGNTQLSITEIADCCGFSSLSNFYRVFHLYKGKAPRTYRKEKGNLPSGNHITRQDSMDINQLKSFWELQYDRKDLLI